MMNLPQGIVPSHAECLQHRPDGTFPFFVQRWGKSQMKVTSFFVVSLFTLAWSILSSQALASGLLATHTTGNDLSYPQCHIGNYPNQAFGIVGVTGGKAFTQNACLAQEFAWATRLSHSASLYINLNAPIGPTASQGMTGPYGHCPPNEPLCQAENYGYNAAQAAFDYARGQQVSSSMWWLDIETANSWASTPSLNRGTIQGAVRFLTAQGGITVGIYSVPSMWSSITGDYSNQLPVWTVASSVSPITSCSSTSGFTGGTVSLVQYSANGFDTDYAC
jgi:hypothetical protein